MHPEGLGGGPGALLGRGFGCGVCWALGWAFSSQVSHFVLRPQEQEVLPHFTDEEIKVEPVCDGAQRLLGSMVLTLSPSFYVSPLREGTRWRGCGLRVTMASRQGWGPLPSARLLPKVPVGVLLTFFIQQPLPEPNWFLSNTDLFIS